MKLVGLILVIVLSLLVMAVGTVSLIFLSLPHPAKINECLITEFKHVRLCPGDGQYVALKQISPVAVAAIVLSEDSSFYSHHGFDWYEMRQSVEKNLNEQSFQRGGSTITQQLAKNVFLTGEKSLMRKIKEAYLTWRLEQLLNKGQILEKYLNVIEMGPGIFGIRAAAKHYFGKTPIELNAAESAFLAMLLPNPIKYYSSFRQKKLTPFARKRVLDIAAKLHATGRMSDTEYNEAMASLDNFPWRGGMNTPVSITDPAMFEGSNESDEQPADEEQDSEESE